MSAGPACLWPLHFLFFVCLFLNKQPLKHNDKLLTSCVCQKKQGFVRIWACCQIRGSYFVRLLLTICQYLGSLIMYRISIVWCTAHGFLCGVVSICFPITLFIQISFTCHSPWEWSFSLSSYIRNLFHKMLNTKYLI